MCQNLQVLIIQKRDELKFNMVNIGGVDVHNGEKKLILATMWLIIRKHTLNVKLFNKR